MVGWSGYSNTDGEVSSFAEGCGVGWGSVVPCRVQCCYDPISSQFHSQEEVEVGLV